MRPSVYHPRVYRPCACGWPLRWDQYGACGGCREGEGGAMACPTCDHTMSGLAGGWYWCPRCGTIQNLLNDGGPMADPEAPALVGRCRQFAAEVLADGIEECSVQTAREVWRRRGVSESINR